jgi:hypothetical protein
MPTLAVGMNGRDSRLHMLAVSLRSLSKHGTNHQSMTIRLNQLALRELTIRLPKERL